MFIRVGAGRGAGGTLLIIMFGGGGPFIIKGPELLEDAAPMYPRGIAGGSDLFATGRTSIELSLIVVFDVSIAGIVSGRLEIAACIAVVRPVVCLSRDLDRSILLDDN